ncbi:hypothetical protein J7E97_34015 [Streptomyces sp. ISL-66]|uniref:hypothetical protein n=1 Tax=Streptomyces sp. ISL-66 TaxID=2819186 RepID=UPI001BE53D65|nr:hypothetical protein [Streptomyces sp. ISL-66]MBT2472734.1 hypothetical protein [Streptomyces sp. ISL-66]
MTYARALRWTTGAAMATAALLIAAPASARVCTAPPGPYAAHAPHAARPAHAAAARTDRADQVDQVDRADQVFEELAGSAAGAGRERPGRPATEPPNPEVVVAARPVPVRPHTEPALPVPATPSAPAAISVLGTEPNERAADLAAHILPLGTGFALMGLGLGYMGMRLRRGR